MSVLVAEDDPAGVELMETVLHGLGIENIIIAESGTEALKAFDEFQASIGLIISDWNMPGLTGGQLFEEVRARNSRIPFLFITGDGTDSMREAHHDAMTHYIQKPYNLDELEDKVLDIIGPQSK